MKPLNDYKVKEVNLLTGFYKNLIVFHRFHAIYSEQYLRVRTFPNQCQTELGYCNYDSITRIRWNF